MGSKCGSCAAFDGYGHLGKMPGRVGVAVRCFLSYNKTDKHLARSIGAHLTLAGIDVWFDEWEIQAGDSIPGKLNEGLEAFDAFILIWSAGAQRSNWVRQELHTAIVQAVASESARIIPCFVDDTPLPPLVADRRGIAFRQIQEGVEELLDGLTGSRGRRERLLAIQHAIAEMDIEWILHPALPPMVCCPNCGETETLKGWEQSDHERGDTYRGLYCTSCGWSDGGEM